MTSDPKLRRWLLHYNRKHFAGQLPIDRITIYWEPCGTNMATTDFIDEEFVIRFDNCLMGLPKIVKLYLNHELVHVDQWKFKRWRDHGNKFDAEIQRLCTLKSYRKLL
jgi:hypothetical protein